VHWTMRCCWQGGLWCTADPPLLLLLLCLGSAARCLQVRWCPEGFGRVVRGGGMLRLEGA
jgi:hypothetical protein